MTGHEWARGLTIAGILTIGMCPALYEARRFSIGVSRRPVIEGNNDQFRHMAYAVAATTNYTISALAATSFILRARRG